jgi:hypothetical protein
LKTYRKLIADRENRPFLDVLNHQMGVFYDKQNKDKSLGFITLLLKQLLTNI